MDLSRDTSEVLNKYMLEHELHTPSWQMLGGDQIDVLEPAAPIGVRYKPMDNEVRAIA